MTKSFLPLDQFIEDALYNKEKGFYTNNYPFGKEGDFITSPHISILFSEMITLWIILFWEYLKCPKKFYLVELGAGNAEMMFRIIKTAKNFPKFYESVEFFIFEKSEHLKKIQTNKLYGMKVKWINDFKKIKSTNCFFLGNEFLDSFAIKQFEKKNNVWFEKYVMTKDNENKIVNLRVNIKKYEKKIGYNFSKKQNFFELSLEQINLIKQISKILNKNLGGILLIDYGFINNKAFNSLQGVKKHSNYDYLKEKGKVDITHLINFDFIKKIFKLNNLKVSGITSQGDFLNKMGIFNRAELLAKNLSFTKKADLYLRLKRLTNKNQMGELFKVIFASNKLLNFKYGFKK